MSIVALDDLGTEPLDTHGPRPGTLRGRAGRESLVESTRSQNITVSCRRSASGVGEAVGERCAGGGLFLAAGGWGGLGRWSRCVHGPFDIPSPHETSPSSSRTGMHVEDFRLEGFEILVIQAEPYLEGWIRHTSLPFQEGDDLVENVVKCHVSASINASSCTI